MSARQRIGRVGSAEDETVSDTILTKTIDILDQARTALLHGEPHQRFNMAAIITDHLAQLRAADEPNPAMQLRQAEVEAEKRYRDYVNQMSLACAQASAIVRRNEGPL